MPQHLISVPYPKPVELYIGLSYNILSPQYEKAYPNPRSYGEWELWEELWDTVLVIMHKEFERQYCQASDDQSIDPVTLKPMPPATMTEDLHISYTLIPTPPGFDTDGISKALASNGLHNGILYLKYKDDYGQIQNIIEHL